ncbi:MAG: glycoside hydrolase, partial [Actinobacteria bacterium]|nr:glycoside hydrolase [Actinomycetota bacterium]
SDHEWSGEPSIQVDDRGGIYIAGTCCVAAAAPVWYSSNGKKFKELETPGHIREWGIGAEGDIAVDHDGHMYFIDTYIPGLMFTRWSDWGKKWDFTTPATGTVPGFDDRPWIAFSEEALYLYVNHVSHTAIYRSTDGGMTWDGGNLLSWRGKVAGQPFFPAHIAANEKTGTLWVSGVNQEKGKDVLSSTVAEYKNGVPKFTEAVVTAPQRRGGFSPIFTGPTAVDAAGNGYTTWSTFDNNGCDVYYAVSTNNGKSWNKPVKVNTGGGCATFPWITAGDDGNIALAWYETPFEKKQGAAEQFFRAVSAGRTLYGGIKVPFFNYQDNLPEDAPWFLHSAAVTGATSKNPKIVETRVDTKTPVLAGPMGRQLWDFLQLDIGPDGRIHIAFVKKFKDGAPQTWYVKSTGGPRLK